MEETPAGADGWIEMELKSLMLQVLQLQTDRVVLCPRVPLTTVGGLSCVRAVTGNMSKTPCAKLGKGKAGL